MEIFGIKFAPLDVPFERRIQTFSVAAWFVILVFGGVTALVVTLYLFLFSKYWWIVGLYFLWIWVIDKDISETGGRPSKWVRSWAWWKYSRDYFPLRFEKLPFVDLDPKRNYLFCVFPHGILSIGSFNAFGTEYGNYSHFFPHHQPHAATLSQHYLLPLFRELALGLGGISSSAKSIDYVLSRPEGGHVCVLMVGGIPETYYCRPGTYKVFLKKRKGFVKLALKNGTPLVPVLSFGETDLYGLVDGPRMRNIQERLKKWIGLTPIILVGRGFFQYSFGIIPHRRTVTTVVGRPLEVPKIENPSREQVEEYHKKFLEVLTEMFEEQKHNYLEQAGDKKIIIE